MIAAHTKIRIVSIGVNSTASIFTYVYAFFGVLEASYYAIKRPDMITFPIGLMAPLIHFNVNLNLPKPTNAVLAALALLALVICYSVNGWLIGTMCAWIFNFVAGSKGGIAVNKFRITTEGPEMMSSTGASNLST